MLWQKWVLYCFKEHWHTSALPNRRNKEQGLNQLQKDKNVKRFKIMQLFSLSCFYFNLQYELLKFRVIFTVHSIFTPTTLQSMVQLCTINNDTVIVGEVSKILNTTIHYQKLLETMIVGEVSRILNTIIHYQKLLETMIVGEWDWINGFGLKYVINNQNENN